MFKNLDVGSTSQFYVVDQADEVDDIIVQYQQIILVVYDADDVDDEIHLHDDLRVEIDDDEEEDEDFFDDED